MIGAEILFYICWADYYRELVSRFTFNLDANIYGMEQDQHLFTTSIYITQLNEQDINLINE